MNYALHTEIGQVIVAQVSKERSPNFSLTILGKGKNPIR